MQFKNFFSSFLGDSPVWYKYLIVFFLAVNPFIYYVNPYVAGWALVVEFIITLAMALKCYPLLPGGLLALQAVLIGMTSPHHVYKEIVGNFEVVLLLMFMVAGIHFMKDLLFVGFANLFIKLKHKPTLSVAMLFFSAVLSAFLDALTVIAVIIAVAWAFYVMYSHCEKVYEKGSAEDLEFVGFLRNVLMHSGIGTALGGVSTMVGEPQNLIIAKKVGWSFSEFSMQMAHISIPVLFAGIVLCFLLELFKVRVFGFGYSLPSTVVDILKADLHAMKVKEGVQRQVKLVVQGIVGILLVLSLVFHVAEVGLIGLMIVVLLTAFTGVTDEHEIGKAFQEAMPFVALICVFFTIVAVIVDQALFGPIMQAAMQMQGASQLKFFFLANGFLSMVSDNVFVGSVYINEVFSVYSQGLISREQFESLAVAINAGTNLPSIATPNGQAAFLFLLTSRIAPYIGLSYGRMVLMAFPYTLVISLVAYMSLVAGI